MKHLQKALSFVLTGSLAAGAMGGTALALDFPDAGQIAHTAAVEELVELGIINGKDDGRFDPHGKLSRAEMAKMAAVILAAGGITDSAAPSYTDTYGHWAEPYIGQCAAQGLISGRGDGTFGPDDVLTGSAAAKILLGMLGYGAETEGLVGAEWQKNTDALATSVGLYEELDGLNSSAALNRDGAAQMICNALNAQQVTYAGDLTQPQGSLQQWAFGKEKTDPKPTEKSAEKPLQPEGDPAGLFAALEEYSFLFSTDNGAGSTELYFSADGTFYGEYRASEEDGKVLKDCLFSGETANVERVDEHTYALCLTQLWLAAEPGQESEEDGIRYITTEPAGIEEGKTYHLYLPGHPVDTLPTGYREEANSLYGAKTMPSYGLYNVDGGRGIFEAVSTED